MQKIDEQYFYVYEWFEGKSLKGKDITKMHCQKISSTLSRIHRTNRKHSNCGSCPININWNYYMELAKEQNRYLFDQLNENKELLYQIQTKGNTSITNIPPVIAICHNDMDMKNVLWKKDTFRIIDLECLAYSNPYIELFESALYWSGYEEYNINFALFHTFIDSYFQNILIPNIDWKSIYYSNYGRFEWLEYNTKRALFLECASAEEQKLGMRQVKETLDHIIYYDHIKREIFSYFNKLSRKRGVLS